MATLKSIKDAVNKNWNINIFEIEFSWNYFSLKKDALNEMKCSNKIQCKNTNQFSCQSDNTCKCTRPYSWDAQAQECSLCSHGFTKSNNQQDGGSPCSSCLFEPSFSSRNLV